jgi:hypothetical protein
LAPAQGGREQRQVLVTRLSASFRFADGAGQGIQDQESVERYASEKGIGP